MGGTSLPPNTTYLSQVRKGVAGEEAMLYRLKKKVMSEHQVTRG